MDIYFVRNATAQPVDTVARFRVAGRAPEIWNAVDGGIAEEMHYGIEDGLTRMPLHLDAYGSVFVVFAREAGVHVTDVLKDGVETEHVGVTRDERGDLVLEHTEAGVYRVKLSDGREMTAQVAAAKSQEIPANQWTITFQADRGAPIQPQRLQDFKSWSVSANAGIRYFSGTATYAAEVDVKRRAGERIFLTLDGLHEICTVRISGKTVGTMWAMPYRLDVTDVVADGQNRIELDVTNLWPNRIIGDAQPGVTHPYTQTNHSEVHGRLPAAAFGADRAGFAESGAPGRSFAERRERSLRGHLIQSNEKFESL